MDVIMSKNNGKYRVERDLLGEVQAPNKALYGVQTLRALENFRISKLRIHPSLATETFDEKCVRLIQAHRERCQEYAERSVGRAAELNEERGFMGAAEVAMKAVESGKSIPEVLEEEKAATK
jgi:aspartate ammonia-lyase